LTDRISLNNQLQKNNLQALENYCGREFVKRKILESDNSLCIADLLNCSLQEVFHKAG